MDLSPGTGRYDAFSNSTHLTGYSAQRDSTGRGHTLCSTIQRVRVSVGITPDPFAAKSSL